MKTRAPDCPHSPSIHPIDPHTSPQLETLRVKSASLEAHVAEASARQKKDARRARKGAETACKEQVNDVCYYTVDLVVHCGFTT